MKMKYTKYYPGHFDGLINICAIFGGMFTIAGILDSLLLKLFKNNKQECIVDNNDLYCGFFPILLIISLNLLK